MNLIPYLAPPLLGAFIGWITNLIAIKMLFRPLKPWRLFGLRLPMTPGVIPAKRHELAVNIGRMVGSQLLTSADISRALSEETFKQELALMIRKRVADILQRDLGPLPTIIPQRFRTSFSAGTHILRRRVLKLLHNHIDSPDFASALGTTIITQLETFLERPLSSWWSKAEPGQLAACLDKTLTSLSQQPALEAWLRGYLTSELARCLAEGKSLADLLPQEVMEVILAQLAAETPGLLSQAAQFVAEPPMRARMVATLSGAIGGFISGLGPMAALAASFLSPEVIETKVNELLADKGEEIAAWLNNDDAQARASEVLIDKARAFCAQPLKELLASLSATQLEAINAAIATQLMAILQQPETIAALNSLIRSTLATQAEQPAEVVLSDLLGEQTLTTGKRQTAVEVITLLRSPKTKRIFDSVIGSLVDNHILGQPIGPLVKWLPKEVQGGIADYLLQQSHALLLDEVPRLVDFLNIQRIVTRKVDSLDLLRLERLLLGIMEEQFKYINLFGGLLGFIIGLGNLFFLIWPGH